MEQNIAKPKGKRRSRQDIVVLLEEFTQAGISVESFCNHHSIGRSTFHKWQSRYKHTEAGPGSFADIRIIADEAQAAALFAEVKGIKLYRPVTAAYLKELLL